MIDKHTIALISIVGCSLDVLGALYLAYDLLGGEHGPVSLLASPRRGEMFIAGPLYENPALCRSATSLNY